MPRFDRKDGLEDVFAHIPVPADPEVFAQAIASGREIRPLQVYFLYRLSSDPLAASSIVIDMLAIIASAQAVSAEHPWDIATLCHNWLIFPHLASWLPTNEAKQLCFAFARAVARIEQLLAA